MPDTAPVQPASNPDDDFFGGPAAVPMSDAEAQVTPVERRDRFSGGAPRGSNFDKQAKLANRKARGEDTRDDDFFGGPPAVAEEEPSTTPAKKPTWKEELVDPAIRGYEKAKQTASVLESQFPTVAKAAQAAASMIGLHGASTRWDMKPSIDTTPEQAVGTIAEAQQAMPAKPQWLTDAETQINSQDTAIGRLAAMAGNPRAFLANTIEGLTASAPTLAAASIGGPLTAIAGGAAGGYLDTYGQTVLQTLQAHGVDISDQKAVQAALNDAPLMSQANMAAQKAGIPAAIINAASFGLAGRVYKPVAGAIGGAAGKVAGVAGEAATQGAIGAGGAELTSQVTKGEDATGGEMMGDALNQTITAAAFTGVHALMQRNAGAKAGLPPQASEEHNTIITHAEDIARAEAEANGGDALDGTVAATHVGATLGAHYDAARYEMHLEEGHAEAAQAILREAANSPEANSPEAKLAAKVQEAKKGAESLSTETPEQESGRLADTLLPEEGQEQISDDLAAHEARQEAFDKAEGEAKDNDTTPSPATAFAKRRAEIEKREQRAREKDFVPARNQVGDQAIVDATKGEEGYQPPTLGDNPVFQTLKERRAAAAKEAPKEPTVAERLKEQNPEDDVLPYTEPKAKRDTAKAEAVTEPEAAPDEDDLPGEGDSWKAKDGTAYEVLKDHGDGTYTIRTTPADSSQLPRRSKVSEATLGILKAKASEPPPEPPRTLADRRKGAGVGKPAPAAKAPRFADVERPDFLGRRSAAALRSTIDRMNAEHEAAQPKWDSKAQSFKDYLAESQARSEAHREKVRPFQEALWDAERAESKKSAKGKLKEVFPGFNKIPTGTKILGTHGIKYTEPTEGKVIGTKVFQADDGLYNLPVVDFGDGQGRTLSPHNISEVHAPRPTRFADGSESTGLSRTDAEAALRPMLERDGTGLRVHDDPSTFPEHIQDAMADGNHPNPRGVYDPSTDTVHINASAHETPEEIQNTYVHEAAHRGLERTLGPELGDRMRDIHENASPEAKKWMSDYAEAHGLDESNPDHQAIAAEEYAAHLAENPKENPGVLRKAIDAVRAGLRKVGIVKEWTDHDIRRLLRETSDNRAGAAESLAPRFKDQDEDPAKREETKQANARTAAAGNGTVESQTKGRRTLKDKVRDTWAKGLEKQMYNQSEESLKDFLPLADQRMPAARAYNEDHMQQDGRKTTLLQEVADNAKMWEHYAAAHPKENEELMRIQTAAGLGEVRPLGEYEPKYDADAIKANPKLANVEKMRESLHGELKARLDKLDKATPSVKGKPPHKELTDALAKLKKDDPRRFKLQDRITKMEQEGAGAKDVYKAIRDFYPRQRGRGDDALIQLIKDSKMDGNRKAAMIAMLRKKFEGGRLFGDYSPLGRYGDYWGVAKHLDKDGKPTSENQIFVRRDNPSELKMWMDDMRAAGFDKEGQLDGGKKVNERSTMNNVDPEFVAKVEEMLSGDTKGKDGVPIDPDGKLRDEIWQTYLQHLPELSMRKAAIHRIGRLGFSGDNMKSFVHYGLHSSQQIARLEYKHRLEGHLEDMKAQVRALEQKYGPTHNLSLRAQAIAQEYRERHKLDQNAESSPLSAKLVAFGAKWFLSYNPGTASRIILQNPNTAAAILGGTHGFIRADKELTRAVAQWIKNSGDMRPSLTPIELQAFNELKKWGVFTNTETQMLNSGGNGALMFTGARNAFLRGSQFLFNGAEHLNRQSTAMAAFRLAQQEGKTYEQAVWNAYHMARKSHVDYSTRNRPRVLRTNGGRVVGLFKSYSGGMIYQAARNLADAIHHEDKATQKIAMKTFAGLMVHTIVFGGIRGLPFVPLGLYAINLYHKITDPDNPYDATAAAHEWLTEHLGHYSANAIMTGAFSEITRLAFSEAADYNHLVYRTPIKDMGPREMFADAAAQALGPMYDIGANLASAVELAGEGKYWRAAEHMVPPALANFMKGLRYGHEGVVNLNGETVISKDELAGWQIAAQMAGMTPQQIKDLQEWTGARKNLEKQITDRLTELDNRYKEAFRSGDQEKLSEAAKNLGTFAAAHPLLKKELGKSMGLMLKNDAKKQATAVAGANLNPKLKGELDPIYGAAPE